MVQALISRPILITGAGRRIGLALAKDFLARKQPVIVSFRTRYPAIDELEQAGALCLFGDFSTNDGIASFAECVKEHCHGLRAIIHNASSWQAENHHTPLADTLSAMLQIHVNTPYLLNHLLEPLLRATALPVPTSFISPIISWNEVAIIILPMPRAKPRWTT